MGSITLGGIPNVSFHILVFYQGMYFTEGSCWKCSWDCLLLGRRNSKVFKRVSEMEKKTQQTKKPKMFLQGCIFRVNFPLGLSSLLALACWASEQQRGKTLKAGPTTGALSLLHINHQYLSDSHKTSIPISRAPPVLVVYCILLSVSGHMNLSLFRQSSVHLNFPLSGMAFYQWGRIQWLTWQMHKCQAKSMIFCRPDWSFEIKHVTVGSKDERRKIIF